MVNIPVNNFNNWIFEYGHYSFKHNSNKILLPQNNDIEVIAFYFYTKNNNKTKHSYLNKNFAEGIEIVWDNNPFKL